MDAVLRGEDALGILPTGGGKSVCYQVPALILPGITIVVSPLVSLMADQVRRAGEAGLPAASIHAGLTPDEMGRVEGELRAGRIRLLLLAPERFGSPRFRALLPALPVSLLTIDEAHCISMWGHDFRPSYRALGEVRSGIRCPVLALTATATPRVRREIEEVLRLVSPTRVVGSFDRSNLRWAVVALGRRWGRAMQREREDRLVALVRGRSGARLVYAATRGRVEGLRNVLARRGLRAEAYHAGLPPGERARVQSYFLTHRSPLVVATNAFGMGIDRPDVRVVVHDQLPGSLEDYYQEAGRAGRDGEPALCVALHHADDGRVHRGFLDRTHPPLRSPATVWRLAASGRLRTRLQRRASGRARLRGVAGYARSRSCRRRSLLAWFGERAFPRGCGGCDRCVGWDGVLNSVWGE